MGRGDDSVKVQLETDVAAILDAKTALADMQEWSWMLARRRWRTADGESFQMYIQRVQLGLSVVHRWMRLLRLILPQLRIEQLITDSTLDEEPTKEHSGFTG